MPSISSIDHLVLTVADLEIAKRFYADILGMEVQEFAASDGSQRIALKFGLQKINLHPAGKEFSPKANSPTPGSADVCFLTANRLASWQDHFKSAGVKVVEGPVARTGANGPITSIYVRDPDKNLIEIATRG